MNGDISAIPTGTRFVTSWAAGTGLPLTEEVAAEFLRLAKWLRRTERDLPRLPKGPVRNQVEENYRKIYRDFANEMVADYAVLEFTWPGELRVEAFIDFDNREKFTLRFSEA